MDVSRGDDEMEEVIEPCTALFADAGDQRDAAAFWRHAETVERASGVEGPSSDVETGVETRPLAFLDNSHNNERERGAWSLEFVPSVAPKFDQTYDDGNALGLPESKSTLRVLRNVSVGNGAIKAQRRHAWCDAAKSGLLHVRPDGTRVVRPVVSVDETFVRENLWPIRTVVRCRVQPGEKSFYEFRDNRMRASTLEIIRNIPNLKNSTRKRLMQPVPTNSGSNTRPNKRQSVYDW